MRTQVKTENIILQGIVERRLFDTRRYLIARKTLEFGLHPFVVGSAFDWASKPMFEDNKVWKFINKLTGLDVKIPYITGKYTKKAIKKNTITTVGKQITAQQLGGTTTTPVTAIALGSGTPSATALGSEITTGGGGRGASTVSNITTTVTGDTEQWSKTFNITGTLAVTEEGLFDNNTSGGNMLASQSFSAINLVNGDTLQIVHKVIVGA